LGVPHRPRFSKGEEKLKKSRLSIAKSNKTKKRKESKKKVLDLAAKILEKIEAELRPISDEEAVEEFEAHKRSKTTSEKARFKLAKTFERASALKAHVAEIKRCVSDALKEHEAEIYIGNEFKKNFSTAMMETFDPLFGGGVGFKGNPEKRTEPLEENLLHTVWDSKTSGGSGIGNTAGNAATAPSGLSTVHGKRSPGVVVTGRIVTNV
jgi:hypothetical protein